MPRGILKSKVWKYENDDLGVNQPIESRWKKYWLEIDDYHGNLTWYEKFRPCTFRSIEISKIVKYFTNGEDCEFIPSCPAVPESKTYRNMFAFPEDIDNDPNKIVFFVVSRPRHWRLWLEKIKNYQQQDGAGNDDVDYDDDSSKKQPYHNDEEENGDNDDDDDGDDYNPNHHKHQRYHHHPPFNGHKQRHHQLLSNNYDNGDDMELQYHDFKDHDYRHPPQQPPQRPQPPDNDYIRHHHHHHHRHLLLDGRVQPLHYYSIDDDDYDASSADYDEEEKKENGGVGGGRTHYGDNQILLPRQHQRQQHHLQKQQQNHPQIQQQQQQNMQHKYMQKQQHPKQQHHQQHHQPNHSQQHQQQHPKRKHHQPSYYKQQDRNRISQETNEDLIDDDDDVENVGANNTNPTLKVGSADVLRLVGKQNYGVTSLIPKHSLDFLCIQNTKFDKGHFNTRAHGCKMLSLGGKSNSPCVGVIISERWVKQVSEFKYIGKEIVVVKIKGDAICVLSVQCPKVLEEIERFKFFENLRECLKSLIEFELIIICGGFEGQSYMERDDRTPILREGINNRDAGMLLKLINEMNLTLENTHLLNGNSSSNGDLCNFILTRNNGANKLAEVRTCSELLLLGHTLSLATFAGDFTVSGHYFRNEDSD